jgi:IclR family acetate operon transcriptional repressor
VEIMDKRAEEGEDFGRSPEGGHRGVERIASILRMAAQQPEGVRLAEIASRLGAPRSSIHSLLKGLVSVGFLEESGTRYLIGRGIPALLTPQRTASIAEAAREDIELLSRQTGETALLGTLLGDSVVYVFQAESTQSIRYTATLGDPRALYPTSIGKLYLSEMNDEDLLAHRNSFVGIDLKKFDSDIAQVKKTGISYNREETVKGVMAVASAIHDSDGSIIAAISVVGPVYRMTEDRLEQMGTMVRDVCRRISYRRAAREHELPSS